MHTSFTFLLVIHIRSWKFLWLYMRSRHFHFSISPFFLFHSLFLQSVIVELCTLSRRSGIIISHLWPKCSFSDTFQGEGWEQYYTMNIKQILKQTNFCLSFLTTFSALKQRPFVRGDFTSAVGIPIGYCKLLFCCSQVSLKADYSFLR